MAFHGSPLLVHLSCVEDDLLLPLLLFERDHHRTLAMVLVLVPGYDSYVHRRHGVACWDPHHNVDRNLVQCRDVHTDLLFRELHHDRHKVDQHHPGIRIDLLVLDPVVVVWKGALVGVHT